MKKGYQKSMNNRLDKMFINIRKDCIDLINNKNIDIDDLIFKLGISTNKFIDILTNRNKDFTIYLKMYNTLLEM